MLGERHGGVLALAAGLAAPDSLSGIIAVDTMLPTVSGWNPPLAPLEGLPVLIAGEHPQARNRSTVLAGAALAAKLDEWGAAATVSPELDDAERTIAIAGWLAGQTPRYGGPAADEV